VKASVVDACSSVGKQALRNRMRQSITCRMKGVRINFAEVKGVRVCLNDLHAVKLGREEEALD
jgi:hypothetical protein